MYVATFYVYGPENVDEPVATHALKGAPFKVRMNAETMNSGTQVFWGHSKLRVVESTQVPKCGDYGSATNHPAV